MEYKTIDFYCKKCRKRMNMEYHVTGNSDAVVVAGQLTMKCPTNKCTRTLVIKKATEGDILAGVDKEGRKYL